MDAPQSLSMRMRSAALGLPSGPAKAAVGRKTASSTTGAGSTMHQSASLPRIAITSQFPLMSQSMTSPLDPASQKEKLRTKLQLGGASLSSKLSGLLDDMAVDASAHAFADRVKVEHPSTLCVRCAKTAAVCIECCQYQEESAVLFYRNARATGAIRFFDRAIIRAGQTNLTKFVIFHIWCNFVAKRKMMQRRFDARADLGYKNSLTGIPFYAWRRFIHKQILTAKNQTIDELLEKKAGMEGYIAKLQTEKAGLEHQLKQMQQEANKKGDIIVSLEARVASLEAGLVSERAKTQAAFELALAGEQFQQRLSEMAKQHLDHASAVLAEIQMCSPESSINASSSSASVTSVTLGAPNADKTESVVSGEMAEAGSVSTNVLSPQDRNLLSWVAEKAQTLEGFNNVIDGGAQVAPESIVIDDAPVVSKPTTSKLSKGKRGKDKDKEKEKEKEKEPKVEPYKFDTFFKNFSVPPVTADLSVPQSHDSFGALKTGRVLSKTMIHVILQQLKYSQLCSGLVSQEVQSDGLGELFKNHEEQSTTDTTAAAAPSEEEKNEENAETTVASETPVDAESPKSEESDIISTENSELSAFAQLMNNTPLKATDLVKIRDLYHNSSLESSDLLLRTLDVFLNYFELPKLKLEPGEDQVDYIGREVTQGNETVIRWFVESLRNISVCTTQRVARLFHMFRNYDKFIRKNIDAFLSVSSQFAAALKPEPEPQTAAPAVSEQGSSNSNDPLPEPPKILSVEERLQLFFTRWPGAALAEASKTVCANISTLSAGQASLTSYLRSMSVSKLMVRAEGNLLS